MARKTVKIKRRAPLHPTPKPRPVTITGRVPVDQNEVRLTPGRGSTAHGGGLGSRYWHIYVGHTRAGYININRKIDAVLGDIAAIQIQLDQEQRGRKIGRVAYRQACELSGYETIYAEMRKENVASRRAAEEAGFVVAPIQRGSQLTMVWHRRGQNLQNVKCEAIP